MTTTDSNSTVNFNPTDLFIGGQWVPAEGTERVTVINPATEEVLGTVPEATAADVDRAVQAARASFDSGVWRFLELDERLAIIEKVATEIEARAAGIAEAMSKEMGSPISVAQFSPVRSGMNIRNIMALAPDALAREFRIGQNNAMVLREPVGVVAAIAPWNGPFGLAVAKIIPALIAGCSVVFKPAPESPFDAFLLFEALAAAGVPDGVVNLVTGGAATGEALINHPEVNKITFTGSTATGARIGEVAGRSFKRMQLELGGKSAAFILEDTDLESAIPGLTVGCFSNTGQVCSSFSRVLVPASRQQEVVDTLSAIADSFVVGDPADPATTMGPLVSERQHQKVLQYIEIGQSEGAKLVKGGSRPAHLDTGWFIEPTIFADVDNSMRIAQEEIFGPVVSVIPYETLDEAIAIANDSDYGLHGAVFTNDPELALHIASRVHTGTFSINSFTYNQEAPFGGVKCSGVGRDTAVEGLLSFTEQKSINIPADMLPAFQ